MIHRPEPRRSGLVMTNVLWVYFASSDSFHTLQSPFSRLDCEGGAGVTRWRAFAYRMRDVVRVRQQERYAMPPMLHRILPLVIAVFLCVAAIADPPLTRLEELTPGTTGAGFGVDYRIQPLLSPSFLYYVVSSPENQFELWCTNMDGAQSQRLRVLVHDGKTNEYYPDLLKPRKYIPYGSAEQGEWWKEFPELPALTYVNDLWGCLVGDRLFFGSHDADVAFDNTELYVTDGAPESTHIVRDINPGRAGAGIFDLTAFGKGVFFFADDDVHGKEPWYSDGTDAGTVLLADINPGPEPSRAACAIFPFRADRQVAVMKGKVWFFAQDGSGVFSLWSSDGTPGGTRHIYTAQPPQNTQMRPTSLTATQTALFWVMADACGRLQPGDGLPRQIWRSDGTEKGTELVDTFEEFGAHLYDPRIHTGDLTAAGDWVYWIASPGAFWRAGSTGGKEPVRGVDRRHVMKNSAILASVDIQLIAGLRPVAQSATDDLMNPQMPVVIGEAFPVGGSWPPDIFVRQREDVMPFPRFSPPFVTYGAHAVSWIAGSGDNLRLFTLNEDSETVAGLQRVELEEDDISHERGSVVTLVAGHVSHSKPWIVEQSATAGGVLRPWDRENDARSPNLTSPGLGTQTTFLGAEHGTLFFRVERAAGNGAIFATKGTAGGATRLFPEPPLKSAHDHWPDHAITWHDGAWYALDQDQLHRIDADTLAVETVCPLAAPGTAPEQATLVSLETGLVCLASTKEGIRLKRFDAATTAFDESGFTITGDRFGAMVSTGAFAVFDTVSGTPPATTLWRTEGTAPGVVALKENLGPVSDYVLGDGVIYAAEWQEDAWRVWAVDGSDDSSREIGQARGSFGLGSPLPVATMGDGRVALLNAQGGRLQITNGTDTQEVKTKAFTGENVLLSGLTAFDGRVYWATGESNFGAVRLWSSDGTEEGTEVAHLFGGRLMHGLVEMAATETALWLAFAASDVQDDVHRELWRYTEVAGAECVNLSDPLLGTLWEPGGTEIDTQIAVLGDQVLFMNYTYTAGAELWSAGME